MSSLACSLLKHLYLGLFFGCLPNQTTAHFIDKPDVQAFINEISGKHELPKAQLTDWLRKAEFKEEIIEQISRPSEIKPWHEYGPIFVTDKRAREGALFWSQHTEVLERAQTTYGVPPEVIIAIIGVETRYGKNTGNYRVIDALATLSFGYPKRAPFFKKELENFLVLTQEEQWNPIQIKGSYAGAIGQPQFMPSSYRNFAIDFDQDGKRNLLDNPTDAIGSVASYFKAHGWSPGDPIAARAHLKTENAKSLIQKNLDMPTLTLSQLIQKGVTPMQFGIPESQKASLLELEEANAKDHWLGFKNFYVITKYNRSIHYAMAVYQLSQKVSQFYHRKDF